jgi:quercetin dioxygenase-like cupin family protein
LFGLIQEANAAKYGQSVVQSQILLRSKTSRDGEAYKSYPSGQPELSILKIILAPHTKLEWHSHPIPSAAYIVAGELTLGRKKDGRKLRFSWTSGFCNSEHTLQGSVRGEHLR